MGVGQFKIFRVFLCTFLEYTIVVVGYFTQTILHTPTTEPVVRTINVINFKTTIQVYDVAVVEERVIIACCSTEVPSIHAVSGLISDTTVWQDTFWRCKYIVWISIEERVGITNRCRSHRTISQSLIRIV